MKSHLSAHDLLQRLPGSVEQAEVYELHSLQTPVRFTAGELESIKSVETAGRALRVIHRGRLGYATTTDLDDASILVQGALAAAESGDPAPFSFPAPQPPAEVQCFDPAVEQLGEGEMIAMGKQAIGRILAAHPDVHVVAAIRRSITTVRIENSAGLVIESARSHLSAAVEAQRTREGDILFVGESISSRRRQDVSLDPLVQYILARLPQVENHAQANPGTMAVVFDRGALPVLFLPLMQALNGRNVLQGASPLADKLGQAAFAPAFDLIDDARLDFAPNAAPHDDEGVPTSRKTLIEGGVLRRFLYDLRTAGQAGTRSTGNGFKGGIFGGGPNQPPDIAPGMWIVTPGENSLQQVLQGLDEALLVEDVLGLGQGNVLAGEFSNNVAIGLLVRRGEIVGRVKNTMIAGNVFKLLKDRLIAVASEPHQVYGLLQSPAIVLEGVGVAC